ncbi:hypothetical protein C8R45DRAFT_1224124 [Mycena sanguinolenta]|nr:hypothetical protein C8R45DRAFT_1224124 [Mycena sanguinolenta]
MTEDFHNKAVALDGLALSPLAASVRQWHFMGDHTLDHGDIHQRLPLIANIHILQDTWRRVSTIFTTTLGAYHLRAALEALKLLEELELSDCDIVARMGTLLRLKLFDFSTGRFGLEPQLQLGALHFIAPNNLYRLMVGDHVDAEPMLKALSGDPIPHLSRITVSMTACSFDCFHAFLACCPQLETIHIRPHDIGATNPISLPDHLPENTLPVLKSFSGLFILAGRFVHNRPVEVVRLQDWREIATKTILSTLSAVSGGSALLRTLFIASAFPVEASPEIFEAVSSCFPGLRSLTLEFIAQARRMSSWECVVVLPEGSPVPRAAKEESARVIPDEKREESRESLPENVLPGYMYDRGDVYPPNFERLEQDDDSSPVAVAMDFIHDGRIVLPPHLEVLNFHQPPPWVGKSEFDTDEQHQAILLLETFAPTLCEIGFCDSQDHWLRDRHLWIRNRTVPGGID